MAKQQRITISQVAQRAGVSKGAVSMALNGKPGLSQETRERVMRVAEDLGWRPSSVARALSVARANACGLVLARPVRTLAVEPFFMEFIAGVEAQLATRSIALTLQVTEDLESECEIYRRWWSERRVDGALVPDLRRDDPRVAELIRLGLPAVVVGRPVEGCGLPSVGQAEEQAVSEVVRYLAVLGHQRIARVAGESGFVHVARRTAAFREITRELSLHAPVVGTDFLAESGARVTRQLLSDPEPPTAIIYDSDVLAITGLGIAQEMGVDVPADLSIVAWDDSLMCQVVRPALTAVTRDIIGYGTAAARRLLDTIDGIPGEDMEQPAGELTVRGSTAVAPARAQLRTRVRQG
jgi:DNA-binding LacI/PurR family transcriptional regulator